MRAVLLYEDKRGPSKNFGPHELIISCVFDDLGGDRFALGREYQAHPKKGIGALLRACAEDVERLAPAGQKIFAVIDDNGGIRDALKLPASADERTVRDEIAKRAPSNQVVVALIHKNTETLVDAVRECLGAAAFGRKPTPAERDVALNKAAWADARTVRDCVRTKVPSLGELVEQLARLS